jgi:hypothetical protein
VSPVANYHCTKKRGTFNTSDKVVIAVIYDIYFDLIMGPTPAERLRQQSRARVRTSSYRFSHSHPKLHNQKQDGKLQKMFQK